MRAEIYSFHTPRGQLWRWRMRAAAPSIRIAVQCFDNFATEREAWISLQSAANAALLCADVVLNEPVEPSV